MTKKQDAYVHWIEFFRLYWHLLDSDKKESYIAMMKEGELPPKQESTGEMSEESAALIRDMATVIRAYREKKKIMQSELAKAMDIGPSYMSLIEKGVKMFTTVDLAKVMKILSIPPEEMFTA